MRLVQADGHAKISYYCSERCKAASYKHLFDGRAGDRKRERDAARSAEKNRRYYESPPGAGKGAAKGQVLGRPGSPEGRFAIQQSQTKGSAEPGVWLHCKAGPGKQEIGKTDACSAV